MLYDPSRDLGPLFEAVQLAGLFEDSKTFVDAVPRSEPAQIRARYRAAHEAPDFDLAAFVAEHFDLPNDADVTFTADASVPMADHLRRHWPVLTRDPDAEPAGFSTLLPLPEPYVVPGGRFREIYYWDSYFTMLGLAVSDRMDLVRSMIANFAALIETVGFIPNGNRTYYLSRSQPPFFAQMVMLLAEAEGLDAALPYLDVLRREHAFWMHGEDRVTAGEPTFEHVVRLPDGAILNRYWDTRTDPRPESYREDYELVAGLPDEERAARCRHLRAGAASGWDYSSRWLADGRTLATIHAADFVPVDLNALLASHEQALARLYAHRGDADVADAFAARAAQRTEALLAAAWDEDAGFFFDVEATTGRRSTVRSLAALFPLYFGLATDAQAARVAKHVERDFLRPGGFVTTLAETGQQWDAPNGWAPLQWITVQGLRRYGFDALADKGQDRWLQLNQDVYQRTGKMMEKYNVVDLGLDAGGGEYALQDGFGWTNGVALAFLDGHTGPA